MDWLNIQKHTYSSVLKNQNLNVNEVCIDLFCLIMTVLEIPDGLK